MTSELFLHSRAQTGVFSQEVGEIHSAADPALRDSLRGLRHSWRINCERLQNIL